MPASSKFIPPSRTPTFSLSPPVRSGHIPTNNSRKFQRINDTRHVSPLTPSSAVSYDTARYVVLQSRSNFRFDEQHTEFWVSEALFDIPADACGRGSFFWRTTKHSQGPRSSFQLLRKRCRTPGPTLSSLPRTTASQQRILPGRW